jgi:hypothetical protein
MTPETRNSIVLLSVVGMGAYLLYKNRSEPKPEEIGIEESQHLQRTLMGEISKSEVMSDDLLRLKRKLDRHAAQFDPNELQRGTTHELEHTRNRLVAQKIAMDHLRENPSYYQILEEVMPEGA